MWCVQRKRDWGAAPVQILGMGAAAGPSVKLGQAIRGAGAHGGPIKRMRCEGWGSEYARGREGWVGCEEDGRVRRERLASVRGRGSWLGAGASEARRRLSPAARGGWPPWRQTGLRAPAAARGRAPPRTTARWEAGRQEGGVGWKGCGRRHGTSAGSCQGRPGSLQHLWRAITATPTPTPPWSGSTRRGGA